MRIIQLDETQTDISTQAHFHPLAIRLYGQHGINATGPTGSEVRQASPPPPKPLLFPFIPSSPTALHSYSSHRDAHFFKPPSLVNNKLHNPKSCSRKTTVVSTFAVDLIFAAPSSNTETKLWPYRTTQTCPCRLCRSAEHKDSIRQLHAVALWTLPVHFTIIAH